MKSARFFAQQLYRTPLEIPKEFRCVSFCFDDFPFSAALDGGLILAQAGARGTFYICFGLLDRDGPSGKIVSMDQLLILREQGHEIGCHTYNHLICGLESTHNVAMACDKNKEIGKVNGFLLDHFAFPEGEVTPFTKKVVNTRYKTARTVVEGINQGVCDAYFLKATPLYERDEQSVFRLIDQVKDRGGWLVLVAHDVSDNPLPYGISRDFLRRLISYVRGKQIPIEPVGRAFEDLLRKQKTSSSRGKMFV